MSKNKDKDKNKKKTNRTAKARRQRAERQKKAKQQALALQEEAQKAKRKADRPEKVMTYAFEHIPLDLYTLDKLQEDFIRANEFAPFEAIAKRVGITSRECSQIIEQFQLFYLNPRYEIYEKTLKDKALLGENKDYTRFISNKELSDLYPTIFQFLGDTEKNISGRKVLQLCLNKCIQRKKSQVVKRNEVLRAFQTYEGEDWIEIANKCDVSRNMVYTFKDKIIDYIEKDRENDLFYLGSNAGLTNKTERGSMFLTFCSCYLRFKYPDIGKEHNWFIKTRLYEEGTRYSSYRIAADLFDYLSKAVHYGKQVTMTDKLYYEQFEKEETVLKLRLNTSKSEILDKYFWCL